MRVMGFDRGSRLNLGAITFFAMIRSGVFASRARALILSDVVLKTEGRASIQ